MATKTIVVCDHCKETIANDILDMGAYTLINERTINKFNIVRPTNDIAPTTPDCVTHYCSPGCMVVAVSNVIHEAWAERRQQVEFMKRQKGEGV